MIDNSTSSTSSKNILLKTEQYADKKDKISSEKPLPTVPRQSPKDQVNISYSSESGAARQYDMSLKQTAADGFDLLRGLVLNIFKEQGLDYKIETTAGELDLSTLSPEEAQELVANDGYFGVEKTAERIFNFAVGIAGNDPARLDAIKEGVNNGFQEALEAFGGELPDISYDTLASVMNKLDEWAGITESPESSIQVKS